MATTVSIDEAEAQLAKLLEKAEQGEEIIIARAGQPVARLTAIAAEKPKRTEPRKPGFAKGLLEGYPEPDDPIHEEIAELFYADDLS